MKRDRYLLDFDGDFALSKINSRLDLKEATTFKRGVYLENLNDALFNISRDTSIFKSNPQVFKSSNTCINRVFNDKIERNLKNKNFREINLNPEIILEAPGFVDDYYLTLLDWSKKDIIAIALEKNVYFYDISTKKQRLFISDIKERIISALSFNIDGSLLAVGFSDGSLGIWNTTTGQQTQYFSRYSKKK